MVIVKCPSGEKIWVSYVNTNGEPVYIITSKPTRDYYYLYEVSENGNMRKLGKSKSPIELEEKYNVIERMKQ